MAKGSFGNPWLAYGAALATAAGFSIVAVILALVASQSSLLLQQLELQQLQAFNAKEFGERMGRFIGAGLALGLAGVGAGIAVGLAGAAAISAFTEKPEVFGRSFLIVVLGEGIAIYGIAIAILVLILRVP
ncbi:MAG: ATP synthase subunit C [Sulfolobales archaeon]